MSVPSSLVVSSSISTSGAPGLGESGEMQQPWGNQGTQPGSGTRFLGCSNWLSWLFWEKQMDVSTKNEGELGSNLENYSVWIQDLGPKFFSLLYLDSVVFPNGLSVWTPNTYPSGDTAGASAFCCDTWRRPTQAAKKPERRSETSGEDSWKMPWNVEYLRSVLKHSGSLQS